MKHLVTGQHQKDPDFSALHWPPHGSLVSIGQHFLTTRVVHLPKRSETSLRNQTLADMITKSDLAVQDVHSCNSWLQAELEYLAMKVALQHVLGKLSDILLTYNQMS